MININHENKIDENNTEMRNLSLKSLLGKRLQNNSPLIDYIFLFINTFESLFNQARCELC